MNRFNSTFFWVLFSAMNLFVFSACKTEDIEPVVSVSIDSIQNSRISESGGKAYVFANLNGKSLKDVKLNLSFTGTAKSGVDYNISASQILIKSGSVSGSVVLNALQNTLIEGDKSIIISYSSVENASFLVPFSDTILISDDDIDTDKDGLNDAVDACPLDSGAIADNGCPKGFGLIINEVLYDPSNSGLLGDANGDGLYDQGQDEFIEFYNNTNVPQNLSGYTILDFDTILGTSTLRYTFPAGTNLAPKKALVVFGGGTPTGSFGGATVLVSGGLSLDNSGEKIQIRDNQGNEVLSFNSNELSGNPNESYTRKPDLTGIFVQHASVPPGKLFSPGTKTDGSAF
jgi:hypothetical protein